jgi:nitroreductase
MIDLVRKRRSIRSYTEAPVDRKTRGLLVETLLRAPSSCNTNPWEFVVVDDRGVLEKLSAAKRHGSSFLKGAPLAIVVCAESTKSDVWIEDCSIASILVQMTAESLGLGRCWIQIRQREHDAATSSKAYIQELLGLPAHLKVESIVSIGHPGKKRPPLEAESLQYDKVKYNRYLEPFRNGLLPLQGEGWGGDGVRKPDTGDQR